MTRKEAFSYLSQIHATTYSEQYRDALEVALSALRPVSREQLEKVWRGGRGSCTALERMEKAVSSAVQGARKAIPTSAIFVPIAALL
jgi:hypothetical protein